MAARETVRYGTQCPSCGQEGTIIVTENDHPYMSSVDLKVKRVEGEFTAEEHGDKDIAVTCLKCQHQYVF